MIYVCELNDFGGGRRTKAIIQNVAGAKMLLRNFFQRYWTHKARRPYSG